MDDLSLEMKKIIAFLLPRISLSEIRMLTTRETYLPVLEELKRLEETLQKEINEAEKKAD